MNCTQCNAVNEESAQFCSTCGANLEAQRGQASAAPIAPMPQPMAGYNAAPMAQQPYQPAQYETPYAPMAPQSMPMVASHLVWAILCFFFTFWPTAIVAIVFASQVSGKLTRGDYAGAVSSSRSAKIWCWVSFGIAIAMWVIIIIAVVATAASVSNSSY